MSPSPNLNTQQVMTTLTVSPLLPTSSPHIMSPRNISICISKKVRTILKHNHNTT